MGNSYHGPNSDCYHCTGCGTSRCCDDCSASCCQDNMRSHRELRRYENSFADEVNNCPKYTVEHCRSIVHDLRNYYDIKIYYNEYNDYLEQSKDIIEKLEQRKYFIINKSNSIKEDNFVKKRLNDLKENHRENMENIRRDLNRKVQILNTVSDGDIENINKEIQKKENEINKLRKEKDEIEEQKKSGKQKFKESQERIFIEKLEEKKNEINKKYKDLENISYPMMEYSQQEKEMKNALLMNIRKIKNYSKIIPNYDFFIKNLELVNYLY